MNTEHRMQDFDVVSTEPNIRSRSVVLGVGNRMRGDDAVGSRLTEELKGIEGLVVFDCGTTPENFIEPVARLNPERILVVDACAFGGEPGESRLFERADLARLSAGLLSTHTLPLSLVVAMLEQEVGATIQVLGVQPEQIAFGTGLSEPVLQALPRLARFVRNWASGRQ